MTRHIFQIVIALLAILIISGTATAEIKVSQSLSQSKIAFEDSVKFEILIEWEGSQTAYLFQKPLSPFIDRMKIGQFSSSVSSQMRDGAEITYKKYNYTLIPTSAGLGLIDSIMIDYLKRYDSLPGLLVTEPMEVLIANPVAKVKEDGGFDIWMIFVFLLVVVAAVFSYVKLQKKKKSEQKQISPKEQFLCDLTDMKNSSASDMKKFQTDLFTALSNFLVTEYSLDVSKINTDALIDELTKVGLSVANAEQISNWMKQAGLDKCAPITQSPGAVVRLESEIRTFFEKI